MDIKEIKIMIEEQYISHKTAKLAWEKGFDEPCEYFLSYECDRFIRCSCTNGKIVKEN